MIEEVILKRARTLQRNYTKERLAIMLAKQEHQIQTSIKVLKWKKEEEMKKKQENSF